MVGMIFSFAFSLVICYLILVCLGAMVRWVMRKSKNRKPMPDWLFYIINYIILSPFIVLLVYLK